MAAGKEQGQRRVYVLPNELVERITAFQQEKNYPSEVEAVRKLLDEALLHRDTAGTIINRFKSRLQSLRIPAEIAKDVLVGHPLVTEISFDKHYITFTLNGAEQYRIYESGRAEYRNSYHSPEWKAWDYDDIPF